MSAADILKAIAIGSMIALAIVVAVAIFVGPTQRGK